MPGLVGTPGGRRRPATSWPVWRKVCIFREFSTWATNRTSPVIGYLRALARHLHARSAAPASGRSGCASAAGSPWR